MKLDLQKLKELEAAATPGPWQVVAGITPDDERFIVEMRNQLPALIAGIEELKAFIVDREGYRAHLKLENSRLSHAERLMKEERDRLEAAGHAVLQQLHLANRENAKLRTVVEAADKYSITAKLSDWINLKDALAALEETE